MRTRKPLFALSTAIIAIGITAAVDTASAQSARRVTTDETGDVTGYERVRRYSRASTERGGHPPGSSFKPYDLRSSGSALPSTRDVGGRGMRGSSGSVRGRR
jgi:hypothetical protein